MKAMKIGDTIDDFVKDRLHRTCSLWTSLDRNKRNIATGHWRILCR